MHRIKITRRQFDPLNIPKRKLQLIRLRPMHGRLRPMHGRLRPLHGRLRPMRLRLRPGPGYDVKLHPVVLHLMSSLCRSLGRSLAPLRYW